MICAASFSLSTSRAEPEQRDRVEHRADRLVAAARLADDRQGHRRGRTCRAGARFGGAQLRVLAQGQRRGLGEREAAAGAHRQFVVDAFRARVVTFVGDASSEQQGYR